MAHVEAEDVADNRLVYGVVGGDENRLAVVGRSVFVEGGADAAAHIFQGLAARAGHGDQMGLRVPLVKFRRVLGFDVVSQAAFPVAVVDFQEPVVLQHVEAVEFGAEGAGHVRPFQGAGNGCVDGRILQALGNHMALLEAPFAQVRVFLALIAAFYIPLRFAVAN